ncbi:hypothetical protein BN873_590009 [Candidatus Competibacter denitrificans Run_A_D11]|uniref:Uncharacterized protein n=1 Tax=Candidatus Competibacter denitrificans Run_A_D11 TaxID=1400863 RepID=W6MA47_9GAMM|nr:hypothetical protein BN873_590009 [Candidatus Competibacter denitrificans Run_A_D11]
MKYSSFLGWQSSKHTSQGAFDFLSV